MASNATIKDLEAMPDDGNRYELIGGSIVMTPAPETVHQRVSRRLARILEDACPPGVEVFFAPVDYDLPTGDRVEPDIVVVPLASVGENRLKGPALLFVEILSPGSRSNDRVRKRRAYAAAGIPAYWILDPARHHVSPSGWSTARTRRTPTRTGPSAWTGRWRWRSRSPN